MKKKIVMIVTIFFVIASCQKQAEKIQQKTKELPSENESDYHGHLKQTKEYSADVAIAWTNMQLELMRVPTVPIFPHQNRYIAYCGLALYESVVPGMPGYQSIASQLNGLPAMPQTQPGFVYYWPACANAALAY